jgi:RimJ/RimL family protein N-acetyltransferase
MIETDRLILRPHRLEDFEPMAAMFAEPAAMRFLTGGKPTPREEVWNRLLRYVGHWAVFGFGLFAIHERNGGRFLGETGFADFHRELGSDFDPFPEAAWVMAGAAHGKGYATEAAEAAHRWLEMRNGPARTVCIIRSDHHRSIRVAERLGYRKLRVAGYRDAEVTVFERGSAPSVG